VRRSHRKGLTLTLLAVASLALASCRGEQASVPVPGVVGAEKSSASVRSLRRAYDGAPPVIGHVPFGADCTNCHTMKGVNIPGTGFAPPMPHAKTMGMIHTKTCTQCHVFKQTDQVWKQNTFVGLRQDLRHGKKALVTSPPVIPHALQMRENCLACHSGPAAREEIRCSHPERPICTQCHVPRTTPTLFTH